MSCVVDMRKWKARRDTHNRPRRAVTLPRGGQGLVSIGIVSAELLRRLTDMDR